MFAGFTSASVKREQQGRGAAWPSTGADESSLLLHQIEPCPRRQA